MPTESLRLCQQEGLELPIEGARSYVICRVREVGRVPAESKVGLHEFTDVRHHARACVVIRELRRGDRGGHHARWRALLGLSIR